MSRKFRFFLTLLLLLFKITGTVPAAESELSPLFKQGKIQYKAGMYDYALHSLDRALFRDPSLYEAANMIAEIYIIKNNRFRAIEYLETSVKINKEQPDTLVRLGEQYEYFLNDREAAAQFRLALSYDPEHIKANAFIVRHYINEGDTEAADRHFSISYEKGRKAVKILSERAYRAGIDKDYDEAVRLYEIIIERAPAFKDAYFHVHDIARFTGQPEISVSVLEKYKRIRPDYARGYYLLGIIYFDEKLPGNRKYNIDRAIRNLERAVEINPGYAAAHYQLSGIYRILKDDIRAEEHFRLAREAEK